MTWMPAMMRISWISADLMREVARRKGLLATLVGGLTVWPFWMGCAEGMMSWAPLSLSLGIVRSCVSLHAFVPATLMTLVFPEIFFARKINRELEPLLAAPVSDREIVAGFVMPALAIPMLYPFTAVPLSMLGFRLLSRESVALDPTGFILMLLICLAAGIWAAAFMLDGVFKAKSQTGLYARIWIAMLAILAGEALVNILRFLKCMPGVAVTLAAWLAAGCGLLFIVSLRLDREDLILRG